MQFGWWLCPDIQITKQVLESLRIWDRRYLSCRIQSSCQCEHEVQDMSVQQVSLFLQQNCQCLEGFRKSIYFCWILPDMLDCVWACLANSNLPSLQTRVLSEMHRVLLHRLPWQWVRRCKHIRRLNPEVEALSAEWMFAFRDSRQQLHRKIVHLQEHVPLYWRQFEEACYCLVAKCPTKY